MRNSWATYYTSSDAIIFVVDSTDNEHISLSKLELFNVLLHPDLADVPLLVLANKIDLETSKTDEEISESLNL